MKHTQEKLEDICQALRTDPSRGLNDAQVRERQSEVGLNKFDEAKKESILQKVLRHSKDLTTIILMAAVVISLIVAISGTGDKGPVDAAIIFLIVVINVFLAVRQEMGAEKALDALKNMHAHMTVVLRGGVKQTVDAVDLVPGDILVLEAGDRIPADARILESVNLEVEESALTGESVPAEKDANAAVPENATLGDQTNMLFSECLIVNGRAKAVVVETGMNTEIGKIAGMLNSSKRQKTPLQKRLDGLGKALTIIALISAVILFAVELLIYAQQFSSVLMNAVALAVAVVPEMLPVTATVTLAYGVLNMAKQNAIIRKIPAVETLGSATVICSDKTGTLTMNRMTIQRLWAAGHAPVKAEEEFGPGEMQLIKFASLASNAAIERIEGEEKVIGDPTETAIVRLLHEKHDTKKNLDAAWPKVFEIPFDSGRKLMTTVHKTADGRYVSITKGAFDRIPIAPESWNRAEAVRVHDSFAQKALRVIAVGYKYYGALPERMEAEELEHDLLFAGLLGMIDPPRPESAESVRIAKGAGIRTVMITGDHVVTAAAIAREIGILTEGGREISGAELMELPEEELKQNVKDYAVYARVSPEDKLRIVEAWQSHGEVVAMTGDGVNDAPALKTADVGIAMGSGSDVSKNASDVILTDDNFSSIVHAVAEGRRVYENIRKVIYSLLSCNISEIFLMLIAVVVGWGSPLVALQLLFINVIADGIPVLFICREPAEPDTMLRKPVGKDASIFADGLGFRIGCMAAIFTVTSLVGFYIGKFVAVPGGIVPSLEVGQTMAFLIVAWSSVVNIFNVRSRTQSLFTVGFKSNWMFFFGLMFSIALITLVGTVPFLMTVFNCVPLDFNHWLIMVALSVAPLVAVELRKIVTRARLRWAM